MKFVLIFLFIISFSIHAQISVSPPYSTEGSEVVPEKERPTISPSEETIQKEKPFEAKPSSGNSRERRGSSFGTIMVGYQLVTTWLPSKNTISYTHNFSDKWSMEGEFSWADLSPPSFIGVDLGGIKEKRYTLQTRRFAGNSFNFTFGAVVSEMEAGIGSDILNQFGQELNANIRAQNLGFTAGFGNRWQFQNGITFGIDYLRLNIPVLETKVEDDVLKDLGSNSDRSDIKKVIRTFNRIPTVVLLGINVGYTF